MEYNPIPWRKPKLDERFDEQTVGSVPVGWREEGAAIRIDDTDKHLIHGKCLAVIEATGPNEQVVRPFSTIDSRGILHFALKAIDLSTESPAFQVMLSCGPSQEGKDAGAFLLARGKLLYRREGQWMDTGLTYQARGREVFGMKLTNFNFSRGTYDLHINNGAFTAAGAPFINRVDKFDHLTIQSLAQLEEVSNGTAGDLSTHKQRLGIDYVFADNPKGYAFGDSITRGSGYGDLAADGSDAYIRQFMARYDFITEWAHNTDGGGKAGIGKWALAELTERIKGMDKVILAFDVHMAEQHELYGMPTIDEFACQYRQLIRQAKLLGTEPIGWVMTRRGDLELATQRRWAKVQEQVCLSEGIRYVDAWNALSIRPFTKEFADQDERLFHTDRIHPIKAGQARLAEAVARTFGYEG